MGQGTESFNASLQHFIGICQYQFEIHNPRKLGPLNLTLYVLIDSGKVDIKRIEQAGAELCQAQASLS